MPLWSNVDANNGAPKFAVFGGLGVSANGSTLFDNVTVGALHANTSMGVFGVDAREKSNASFEGPKMTHSGWVSRREGTGYVRDFVLLTGGAGYTPGTGYITFIGGGAGSGANVSYQVNAAGNIANVTVNSFGANYNVAPTANTVAAYTVKATWEIVTGGRVGRKEYITLVASGSMATDNVANNDDAIVGA
jgi:hypothetical protein